MNGRAQAAAAHQALDAAHGLVLDAYKNPPDLAVLAAALRARSAAWAALADASPYGLHVHYTRALIEAATYDAAKANEFERLAAKEAGR